MKAVAFYLCGNHILNHSSERDGVLRSGILLPFLFSRESLEKNLSGCNLGAFDRTKSLAERTKDTQRPCHLGSRYSAKRTNPTHNVTGHEGSFWRERAIHIPEPGVISCEEYLSGEMQPRRAAV